MWYYPQGFRSKGEADHRDSNRGNNPSQESLGGKVSAKGNRGLPGDPAIIPVMDSMLGNAAMECIL